MYANSGAYDNPGFAERQRQQGSAFNLNKVSPGNNRVVHGFKSTLDLVTRPSAEQEEAREQWGSKAEFVLSCVGMSVGLGNIWRFPATAYENGGGSFVVIYFILLFLIGRPMYFLELAVGQFCGKGTVTMWKCAPLFKGVGWAMVISSLLVAIYYNVIIAYTVFYMATSLKYIGKPLPWTVCDPEWGANENCFANLANQSETNCTAVRIERKLAANQTGIANKTESPANQFWNIAVLGIDKSSGIHDIGPVKWELCLCLLATWIVIYLCMFKGIRSTGKVVYFTATFPYVVLLALMIRGVTLDNAGLGLYYFFFPKAESLYDPKVWSAAAQQMFYSLSLSIGCLGVFGSYCKFNNKVHRDAYVVGICDTLTSLIGGIVVFSVLGNIAGKLCKDVGDVVDGGFGLAFVTYAEALGTLPGAHFWAFLFFFMLFTLGLDSEFAMLETVTASLYDEFPGLKPYKNQLFIGLCVFMFLTGLPCVTMGGQYVLTLMDTFSAFGLLGIAALEMMGFMWIYGFNNVADDINMMLGFKPGMVFRICWVFISPVVLAILFIYSSFDTSLKHGDYLYPWWGHFIGWLLALASILFIPVLAGLHVFDSWRDGDIRAALLPADDWGPREGATPNGSKVNIQGVDNPSSVM